MSLTRLVLGILESTLSIPLSFCNFAPNHLLMVTNESGNNRLYRWLLVLLIIGVLVALVLIPQFRDEIVEIEAPVKYHQIDGRIFVPEESPIRDRIEIGVVKLDTLRKQVSAPASVETDPSKKAQIFPPVGGRIVQLFVRMGQEVRRGQQLFEIYSPEIAEVQTEFINARSSLAQAERALRRTKDLHERGISPERELEEARTEYEIAQSELEGVSLKMDIMGMSEEDMGKPLIIRSPISGKLIDLNVAPGEFIAEPDEPLMLIADLSSLWVTANIQEKDIRFIHEDADAIARFAAYPGEVHEGTVLFIGDMLDVETRTTRVTIEFDNPQGKLKPGMFANVIFKTSPQATLVVDPQAVLQRRDFNYVYVEVEPHTYEKRRVTTGDLVDGKLVISSGLAEGERLVVRNAVLLP